MANSWNKVKQTLWRPFWRKKRPRAAEKPETLDRRREYLNGQIASLDKEIDKLRRGITLGRDFEEIDFTLDLRQRLIRSRDLRYKVRLLEAEIERIDAERDWPRDETERAPEVEDPPPGLRKAAEVLASIDFESHSLQTTLEKAVSDLLGPRPDMRRAAIRRIGELHLPESIPLLKAALAFEDDVVSTESIRALTELKDPGLSAELERALSSPSHRIRLMALRGLYNTNSEASTWACLQGLADFNPEIRRSAATFLGLIGAHKTAPALAILLRDEEVEVRAAAAKALGDLSSEQAVCMLIRALEDRRVSVRVAAREGLSKIFHDPLDLDVNQSPEILSVVTDAMLRWWAKVRPEGPPWSVPASLIADENLKTSGSYGVVKLFRKVDKPPAERGGGHTNQGSV